MKDELHRIATQRDSDAFDELFRVYAPRIKAFMMRQGADAGVAEDLAQETLLTVWRKAALYSGELGSPIAWLFRIARNLRIDRLRREFTWHELTDEAMQLPGSEMPADDRVIERQRQARVRAALATLPPEQREIIELAYMDGYSQSEIAARLSVPLGTVKSRMRLAYQKVRNMLEDLQ